jgi:uncharacterized membrane protein
MNARVGRYSSREIAQLIVLLSGALLIVVGLVLVCWQFYILASMPKPNFPDRELQVTQQAIHLRTTYVGLMVLVTGAVLEAVGYLSAFPWRVRAGK